jgi:threonine dehydrogenase-like Zn-dependent dehydrogenase
MRRVTLNFSGGRHAGFSGGQNCADGILNRTFSGCPAGVTGKELSIFSSRLNAHKFPVVLAWLEQGLIDPEALITHVLNIRYY